MCSLCNWEDVLSIIDDTINKLDDIPDQGQDFAESVRDKLVDISEWIERSSHVTANQSAAVDRMAEGVDGWLR